MVNVEGEFADENGSSRGISSPEDRALLLHLRKLSDVVLVSAKSAEAEQLSSTSLSTLAIVLGAGPAGHIPAMAATKDRVLVFAPRNASHESPLLQSYTSELVPVANRVPDRISPSELVGAIDSLGFRFPLSEFGPGWLNQLASEGVIDELCLTVTKKSDQSFDAQTPLLAIQGLLPGSRMSLSASYEVGDNLFTRWSPA